MPIEDSSRPVVREGWRRERYSAAEQLREAKECQFSFLPFEELAHSPHHSALPFLFIAGLGLVVFGFVRRSMG